MYFIVQTLTGTAGDLRWYTYIERSDPDDNKVQRSAIAGKGDDEEIRAALPGAPATQHSISWVSGLGGSHQGQGENN